MVNPFIVKDIEVFKGGYDARYGNRVGGIVNITGKNGTLQKPTLSFNINGMDAFIKKDIGFHSVWASYTLSRAEEQLSLIARSNDNFEPAAHDQRQEF